jgi:hypothetical protein
MKYFVLTSIGAIVAGMAVGAILSVATDKILETTGIMKITPFGIRYYWYCSKACCLVGRKIGHSKNQTIKNR